MSMSAAQQAKSAEPTMEEILASIRQIISDDQPAKAAAPAPAAAPVAVAAPAPSPVRAVAPPAQDDDILDLIAPQKGPRPVPTPQASFAALSDAVAQERLLSSEASHAASTSFGNLAHTVLAQNARTLDDVVLELLRPMIKGWLDDHLPPIVERLVRAEIERVARGGR
jgi:uncharacterized protein